LVFVVSGLALIWWRSAPERPWSVLLVTVDTLRADHVSLLGYDRPTTPNIDRFFAGGEIYARAYSAEANTSPSVVSILTGLYPQRHRVRLFYQLLPARVETLPDMLSRAGFQTAAVVSNVVLTAEAIGLDRRFDVYDDAVPEDLGLPHMFERKAPATTDAAIRWLTEQRDASRPHFLWVHYIDPHGPYAAPAGCGDAFSHDEPKPLGTRRIQKYQRREAVRDARVWIDRYDEEISCVDTELGRLLETYGQLGLTGETLFVFTADHGETMDESRRYFSHGFHVWEPIMRVPLLIRTPEALSARIDSPVSLVDLVPTILTKLDLPVPPGLDGTPRDGRPETRPVFLEATGENRQQRAAIVGTTKWLVTVDRSGGLRRRWTAAAGDPESESRRLPWRDGWEGDALLRWIAEDPDPGGVPVQFEAGMRRDAPKVAPGRSERELESLRALGYVE